MLLRGLRRARPLLRPPLAPWRRGSPHHFSAQTPPTPEGPQHALPHPPAFRRSAPPPPPPVPISPAHSPSFISSHRFLYFISGTLISATAVATLAALIYSASSEEQLKRRADELHRDLEAALERSKESLRRIVGRMKQTGAAAAVLWKSLASVLSSANQEVQKEFEFRVAAFVADIVAVNEGRRSAIVSAGGGAVVDWLLQTVARPWGRNARDHGGTQAESARALAYLIADPNVREAVLGRPHAVPNLLRFIFSFQPKRAKKKFKHGLLDGQDTFKGRSKLVAAIMDIVTANCDNIDLASFRPSLPGNADIRDIAAALEVIEEGNMHFDEQHHRNEDDDEDDDGDKGIRGIGIKILGDATVLGFLKNDDLLDVGHSDEGCTASAKCIPDNMMWQENQGSSVNLQRLTSLSAPGLWDDLQRDHVAVPFAAWALANWAISSKQNRSHIQELDSDGHAVMTALSAPERTVKWHGCLVAHVILEDHSLPLTSSVPDWSFSLLSTICDASKAEDVVLARVALSAFLLSIERSNHAKMMVMEKGLHLMRQTAKQAEKHRHLREALARAMELLCSGEMHLSLEESQRWSGILLRWIFAEISSDATCLSAKRILSCILEDYGPASIPISQGWLTMILNEIIGANKTSVLRGTPQKTDKVKTQIDQSNILSAAQAATQLAGTVSNVALNQREADSDSSDRFPLADFLSLEPFATVAKKLKKDKIPKIDAADSAFVTLKGIKALTEICSDDSTLLNKIADFGVLCLLRRFLLQDDYERLAAIEAYDASRAAETRERGSTNAVEASSLDTNDSSSVRVPPTAHIRKHSARLLMMLSLLPKVQKTIRADKMLCKWLEDCANGRVSGCNDLKIQSYARATLLNAFCLKELNGDANNDHPETESVGQKSRCPHYNDMIFLINPELPHWKYFVSDILDADLRGSCDEKGLSDNSLSSYGDGLQEEKNDTVSDSICDFDRKSQLAAPVMDVVFVHGLRGGPFKSWRIADNKSSTTSRAGLVEKIDQEAGREGTCWPKEWLASDLPDIQLFTVKYKTNLTQWSGASLPLQEVSSKLLDQLVAAGIGNRPVVFVTHSMGGLVVKQMLYHAKMNNLGQFVDNTIGLVFYSCPHFGSKLADMPWRMGLVFRPAPTIGELRSGSPRLVELNDFIRHRFNKRLLDVLSFSETQVTPIVEGYGGWAFRMEVVPMESAYPGFGDIIVLDATDHINSCKPVNRTDPSYARTLEFLQKLKESIAR